MPFAKKVAENGRTFQDEGMLNFSEYSTDERKVVCIVAPYQLADAITDIIQADLPHPLAIKKSFAELRVTMGFTVCIDKFVNLSYAIKVKEIMSMCCRRSVDEEQLLRYYRNELMASMQLKPDPNSFVVEETNITNRKVEDENAVANLLDDMLLPLIDESHSPPADVFGDFDLADIVFPNEANEREVKGSGATNIPNNAKSVAVDNENERKKKRIHRGKGKGSSFCKLVQRQRESQLLSSDSSSSSDDSSDEE
eukprot:gene17192-18923_t